MSASGSILCVYQEVLAVNKRQYQLDYCVGVKWRSTEKSG